MSRKISDKLLKAYGFNTKPPKPEGPHVVNDILPQGLHLLVGPATAGKTTLALQLADRVTKGKKFFGHPTRRGGVLLLLLERSVAKNESRLQQVIPDRDPRLLVWNHEKLGRPGLSRRGGIKQGEQSWQRVRDFLKAYKKDQGERPRLLVIDSLTQIAPNVKAYDMTKYLWTLGYLRGLLKYVDCILVLHHVNKAGLDKLFLNDQDVRDHAVILQETDARWMLGREHSDDFSGLRVTGQVPEDKEMVLRWCSNSTLSPVVEMTPRIKSAQAIGQRLGVSFKALLQAMSAIARRLEKRGVEKPIKADDLAEYFGTHKQSPLIHSLYLALGFERGRKWYKVKVKGKYGIEKTERKNLRVYYLRDGKALVEMQRLAGEIRQVKGVRR